MEIFIYLSVQPAEAYLITDLIFVSFLVTVSFMFLQSIPIPWSFSFIFKFLNEGHFITYVILLLHMMPYRL